MFLFSARRLATAPPPPARLAQRVRDMQRSPSYLRHAPPSLYVTCGGGGGGSESAPTHSLMRHSTRLLDAGIEGVHAAHSCGVYVLSSTTAEDYQFEKMDTVRRMLVDLPAARTEADAAAFLERNAAHLTGLHSVLLTSTQPNSAVALRALLTLHPQTRVFCSTFGTAYFTDEVFFNAVRIAVLQNNPGASPDTVVFAGLKAGEEVHAVQDNDVVPMGDGEAGNADFARVLRALCVSNPARAERLRKAHKHYPPHFIEQPIWWLDTAFQSLHVGGSLQRVPWVPHIIPEVGREVVIPLPPLMAARRTSEGALLDTWRVKEHSASLAETLRRVPGTHHILSQHYGALPGNAEDCLLAVENTADQLEVLRSRLALRLETDTSRDVQRWGDAMLRRVISDVYCVNSANPATAEDVKKEFHQWAAHHGLGDVSLALAQAALTLPPSVRKRPDRSEGENCSEGSEGAVPPKAASESHQAELEGAAGVALLRSIFAKKGLTGLAGTLEREEIDVRVFMAMTAEDFRKVFKATFGVSKKLMLLQEELRGKM